MLLLCYTLCKICKNTGFEYPAFSLTRTESTILPTHETVGSLKTSIFHVVTLAVKSKFETFMTIKCYLYLICL